MNNVTGIQIIGPFQADQDKEKLFSFLHRKANNLSRNELHQCFKQSYVYLNHIPLNSDISNQTIRLNLHDIIEIKRDIKAIQENELLLYCQSLQIIDMNDNFAVVWKPAGISSGYDSLHHKAILHVLRQKYHLEFFKAIYFLKKGQSGLEIIARNEDDFIKLKYMLCTNRIQLSFKSILCGVIGEINEIKELQHDYPICNKLNVKVIECCRSRMTNYLSFVDLIPVFNKEDMGFLEFDNPEDYSWMLHPKSPHEISTLNYPSMYIKLMRKFLLKCGYPIVGDIKMVKKSKGLFSSLTSLQFESFKDIHEKLIEIPCPSKFQKLLLRENELWEKHKSQDLILFESMKATMEDELSDYDDEFPVQYQLNKAIFLNYEFYVTTNVMIPKISSEVLVIESVKLLESQSQRRFRILDIGVGSGCLCISIMKQLQLIQYEVEGLGIDISNDTLDVFRHNISLHQLNDCLDCQLLDFKDLYCLKDMPFDLIVCNPPYSCLNELSRISKQSREFEPSIALFTNNPMNSLESYEIIAESLFTSHVLNHHGYLVLEVGHGQIQDVIEIMLAKCSYLRFVSSVKDHKGIHRCIIFQIDYE